MTITTKPQAHSWAIDDPVTRLRVVGSERTFVLAGRSEWVIGTGADCNIQLEDPSGRTSRRHARVDLRDGWWLEDLDSTNGTRCDGEPRRSFQLTAGTELGIGGVQLLAESERLAELRSYLRRILGWSAGCYLVVDRAIQAVRAMARRRAVLVVAGAGDLTACMAELHHRAVSASAAMYVVADTASARRAISEAGAGTICIVAGLPPRDIEDLVAEAVLPDSEARLSLCCESLVAAASSIAMLRRSEAIVIPPIAERSNEELDRMICEFAEDAAVKLEAKATGFRDLELVWLRKVEYASIAEIADTALRVVAIRNFGVTGGAGRLGISHGSLSKWAKRRRVPT